MPPETLDPGGAADAPTKEQLAERAGGFVWPPRPIAVTAPAADSQQSAGTDPFEVIPDNRPLPPAPSPSWLSTIERIWLDVTAAPLPVRLAEAGCAPDSPGAYCHRCARSLAPHEHAADGCHACRDNKFPWDRIVRLGEYRPPWSRLVHEVKFTRWRRLGSQLGALLGRAAAEQLGPASDRAVVVVPVPISFRRRMERGIDHTLVLSRAAARELGGEVRSILWRRHRPSQLDVPPSDRAANIAGSIRLRRRNHLAGDVVHRQIGTIVVLDDVTTSGATMRAACRAVREGLRPIPSAGRPQVLAAVIARTPDRLDDSPDPA